jgi:hypothetical protein
MTVFAKLELMKLKLVTYHVQPFQNKNDIQSSSMKSSKYLFHPQVAILCSMLQESSRRKCTVKELQPELDSVE